MQYLDVTRFMFSVPEPPTRYNSVVLQDDCYSLNSAGYPADINSGFRIVPDFNSIKFVTVRLDTYSFAIDQLWRDLQCVLDNKEDALWLTVINVTTVNVYDTLFNNIGEFSKPVHLQIFDNAHPGTVKSYDYESICTTVPNRFALVDLHYARGDSTVFVPVYPIGETVVYDTHRPGALLE